MTDNSTRDMADKDKLHSAIYDGSEGFLAPWYFGLRASEEASRSERYNRALSLIVVETEDRKRGRLESWFLHRLRTTDLISRGGPGRYFILLPETDEAKAWEVGKRLLAEFAGISLSGATLPLENDRFDALLYSLAPSSR